MVKIPPELGFIRQSADVLTDERLTENANRVIRSRVAAGTPTGDAAIHFEVSRAPFPRRWSDALRWHDAYQLFGPILTPEDVVRRIAAECTFTDERGAVGIRLKPAAAIVRQYGEQFRRPPRRKQKRRPKPPPLL
jgi:hypothetical protein